MANWFQYFFLDSLSFQMEQSIFFYDILMVIICSITGFVFSLYIFITLSEMKSNSILEDSLLESLWTCFPMILMIAIVIPSLRILYTMEENFGNEILFKTTGHQWYWSYEYPQFQISFDSFMLNPLNIQEFEYRLLDVNNRAVLPALLPINISSSSDDVLHSWTIPAWSLKIDSIPGKINQTKLILSKPGIVYGQCSEICGANHSFMPIVIEILSLNLFNTWLNNF
uniref:Cytochrome c oxidase subunit 2 n=1 Tax=Gnathostomula paradoxa TaxID=66783 RepID=A0A0F6Q0U9_9BILA|nr:cytochrome c oxidase subunit 2 [Gnathostomula paradoxa]AKD00030.1 cytochrome c oxidase subunit 2 [Gnathostomula paradoxa]